MKKLVATMSVLSMMSLSALPAMANENHGFHGQSIKAHFNEHNNKNINLTDIQGSWAEKYILDLVKKGVLSGVDNRHFEPNQSVTRAQWSVMVSRYFGLTNTSTTQDFVDVPTNSYAYPYVEATKPYFDAFRDLNGQLHFRPDTAATRQDVTVTLVKILTKLDPSIQLMDTASANALLQQQFSDWNSIDVNLRPYVATAVQYNLIHGDGKGHFLPLKSLTRAEAATLLDLLLDNGIVVDGGTTTSLSNVTTLTTTNNSVVTAIDNYSHTLTVANGMSVAALQNTLSVDSGRGTVAIYTDSTHSTLAPGTALVTNGMVVVATAQDGTTKTVYTIYGASPYSHVTTLTTLNNAVVTKIDNYYHALTVTNGTSVATLMSNLSVDSGSGRLAVYTDATKTTAAASTATVTGAMVVVATAQDGTTQATYTVQLATPLSHVTTLTTRNNAVVTAIDNYNHNLQVASNVTVQALKNSLTVDGGQGTFAIYTDNTLTALASNSAHMTSTMVLVSTAQDGVTKATYVISAPTPPSKVTTLTTNNNNIVTGIDNTYHALTVVDGTTVATLKSALSVDGGKGTVAVYTDNTKSTVAADTATLTNDMVVVSTAQDGTTTATYTITL